MPESQPHPPFEQDMAVVYRQMVSLVDSVPYHPTAAAWLETFHKLRLVGRDIWFAATAEDTEGEAWWRTFT